MIAHRHSTMAASIVESTSTDPRSPATLPGSQAQTPLRSTMASPSGESAAALPPSASRLSSERLKSPEPAGFHAKDDKADVDSTHSSNGIRHESRPSWEGLYVGRYSNAASPAPRALTPAGDDLSDRTGHSYGTIPTPVSADDARVSEQSKDDLERTRGDAGENAITGHALRARRRSRQPEPSPPVSLRKRPST